MKYLKLRYPVLSAASFVIGTAIGAGIFAIPAAVDRVGFTLGIFYLVALGLVATLTLLAYTEVVLATPERMQMSGYANRYLGTWGRWLIALSLIVGLSGALSAYVFGVSELLQHLFGGSVTVWAVLFLVFGGVAVGMKLKTLSVIEGALVAVLLLVMVILAVVGLPSFSVANLAVHSIQFGDLLLPWGVILFAFGALTAVPDMIDLLGTARKKVIRAVALGMGVPAVVYIIFTLLMIGIIRGPVPENALIGLQQVSSWLFVIGAAFGILTMSTSFTTIGTALKELYMIDFHLPRLAAVVAVMTPPVLIGLTRTATFLEIIGTAGAVMGGLEGIVIFRMWDRVRHARGAELPFKLKISPLFADFIMVLYVVGMVAQLWIIFR